MAAREDGGARDRDEGSRHSEPLDRDYGGRAELVEAARQLVADGVSPENVSEQALADRLYAPELPEVDLVVRTSGELRLSNFLLWEAAYAELVFTETLWPDFEPQDLREALAEFASRQRRFGGRESSNAH
jgi:undecaprenyl diphosphate synthase